MSVLSSQADELREAARQFDGYQNGEISRMLREAADTIESLQDRLQERECERVRDDVSGLDIPHNGWYVCSKCGEPLHIMNRYCGGCGAIVRKVDA